MHIAAPASRLWRSGTRWTTRLLGSAPLFLTVVLSGVCVGTLVFAVTYTPKPSTPAPTWPTELPAPDDIESARTSLQEAQLLFGFLSGAATSASSGISTITTSAGQIFDSVDTATLGADQLVVALTGAPDLTTAAGQISSATTSAGTALHQAQNLSAVAAQFDQIVSPLLATLKSVPTPGSDDTRKMLQDMQTSARALSTDLGNLSGLQTSLDDLGTSVERSASSVNSAISSARSAAVQLRDGLSTLGDARTDAVAAAEQVTAGVEQLSGVLTSIGDDINAATNSLAAPEADTDTDTSDTAAPLTTTDNSAVTTAIAIGVGALSSLAVLLVISRLRDRDRHTLSEPAADEV